MLTPYSRRRWKRMLCRIEKAARSRGFYGRAVNDHWGIDDRMGLFMLSRNGSLGASTETYIELSEWRSNPPQVCADLAISRLAPYADGGRA